MKKICILMFMLFALVGCAGTMTGTPSTASPVVSAQNAAEKSLLATGAMLEATPGICDALYNAGKISKTDYNNVTVIYNRSIASFKLAVSALNKARAAGEDPNKTAGYLSALAIFTTDAANIQNLLAAMGQQPIGEGVTK